MSVGDDDTMRGDEGASLERVREILFGARSRDVDTRIARLEARMTSELNTVREELRRRFADLESHVRGEIEALSSRIDGEATARVDATSLLAKEMREAGTSVELRVNRVDESSARGQRELRRQILDMTRELGTQITRAREELFASLGGTNAEAIAEPIEPEQADRQSVH